MALHTSVCIVLLGLTLVIHASKDSEDLPPWLVIPVSIGFIVVSMSMWRATQLYEDAHFAAALQNEVDYIALRGNDRLQGFYGALDRIGDRWQNAGGVPHALWDADITNYLKALRELKAVEWIDASGQPQWSAPAGGADPIDWNRADSRGMRDAVYAQSRESRAALITAPLALAQGGEAFIHIDPLYVGDRFDGWLSATFTLSETFDKILKDNADGPFYVTIADDGTVIYSNAPPGYILSERWLRKSVIRNMDRQLDVSLVPAPALLAKRSNALSELVLAAGLLMSVFASFAVVFAFRWRRDASSLRRSEDRLQKVVGLNTALNATDFNMQRFMDTVLKELRDLVPADGAVIEMIEADELIFGAATGTLTGLAGARIKRQGSLAGLCAATGQVLISDDVSRDPRVDPAVIAKTRAQSAVVVPLFQRGRVVGVLGMTASRTYGFSQSHVSTLQLVAGLVGGALGQEMEIDRRRKMEDELRQIIGINAALNRSDFDMQAFMDLVVDRLRDLVPATGAVIEMMDGDEMVYDAVSGTLAAYRGFRIPRRGSLSGLCVESGDILIAHDTLNDSRVNAEACRKVGAMSAVAVPLRQRGRIIGVLKIVATIANVFVDKDIATLQLMAGMVGGALGQEIEIERRRRLEDELRHLAHSDALTGLPNRALFHDRLSQAIINNQRNGKHLAIIYMDIDHFKSINDTYGHAEGDALLKEFSNRVNRILRKGDTLARLGGDEFVAIAENLRGPDDARVVAEKIMSSVEDEFNLPGLRLKIGLSLGVAVSDQPDLLGDRIVERADQALYEAKRAGRQGYRLVEV